MKFTKFLILFSMLNFIYACGSDNDDDDSAQNEESQQQEDQGTYQAILTPLNVTAAGTPSGTTTIRIRGDEVDARNIVKDTPESIIHRQHIWNGSCPTPANDTNQDGFVDYNEAKSSLSSILIPLDNELSGQIAGGVYPVSNPAGNYTYREVTSLARLLADLRSPDPVPTDDFSKLNPADNLNLAGKSVVLHGVKSTFALPASVSSTGDAPAHRTLPIACGTLVRVADTDPEPAPVPVPSLCPVETEFSTRLNNQLLIEGVRCRGGETTQVENADGTTSVYVCPRGRWLVNVDNINTCTDDGLCTEIFVFPIITSLSRAGNSNPPEQCTFNFTPRSPASPSQRTLMNDHQVRFSRDTEPVVIRKN